MIEELHARDLALIEETWIELGGGMTVLTGETGAGKTVLLGALKLLLGERADSTAVRAGATEAVAEGRFVQDGREIVVRRRVGSDGRSRCTLDGDMATVGLLAERIGPLVDLHGQHEHQALLSASTHVGYLDRWAGEAATAALKSYDAALAAWKGAREALESLESRVERARRDAEQLRFVVSEIDKVGPRPGEDEELEARLPSLIHGERLAGAATEAVARLRGDGGAVDDIAQAVAALGRVSGIDPRLDRVAEALGDAQTLVDELGTSAREYRDGISHDPAELDSVQSRLAELAGLARRFGPTLTDVHARRVEAADALRMTEDDSDEVTRARDREAHARASLEAAEAELARVRRQAAPSFCGALANATEELAMGGASFEVSFTALDFDAWSSEGGQRVEFLFSTAPGQPARPLTKIASGGEVSRVMLALKGVLGEADGVDTLVFDEVDSGIGGATATVVGARLASLAQTHQVIVVTHLAQVAAFADTHYVVRKAVEGGQAMTTVAPVEGDDRTAEIARMLSGSVSDASRVHARELIEAARGMVSAG